MKTRPFSNLLVILSLFSVACKKDSPSKKNTSLNKVIYQHEVASGQNQLYIMDADGSNQIALTNTPNLTVSYADKSSYGNEVIFHYRNFSGMRQINDIYSVAADGSSLTQLTNTPNNNETGTTFSSDGTKILYLSNTALFVMDTDGSNTLQLTNPSGLCVNQAFWSSDGNKIIFSAQTVPLSSTAYNPYKLYSIDVDGNGLTTLSTNFDIPTISACYDNKLLFMTTSPSDTNTSQLFESNIYGTNQVQLTNDSSKAILKVDLSPDKSKLLLTAYVYSSSEIEYFISNTNGTNQQKLINDYNYYISNISWSPNSDQLIFSAYVRNTAQTDIFIINSNGTGLTQITNDLFAESNPIWK